MTSAAVRPVPRSLANIYRELEDDLGHRAPVHGDLTAWADAGVMLLNRVLSVRSGAADSHRGRGWEQVTEQAVRTLELSVLAKYAFGLAQRFNGFYHSSPVIAEENEAVRRWRAAGVHYFQSQMTRALALMGCEVPPRM